MTVHYYWLLLQRELFKEKPVKSIFFGLTIQEGEFIGADNFKSIEVSGTITNVGTATNTIEYTLFSSAKESNYNIIRKEGTLEITARKLTIPANHGFSITTPGMAEWVAVTRDNLTVSYELKVYRMC